MANRKIQFLRCLVLLLAMFFLTSYSSKEETSSKEEASKPKELIAPGKMVTVDDCSDFKKIFFKLGFAKDALNNPPNRGEFESEEEYQKRLKKYKEEINKDVKQLHNQSYKITLSHSDDIMSYRLDPTGTPKDPLKFHLLKYNLEKGSFPLSDIKWAPETTMQDRDLGLVYDFTVYSYLEFTEKPPIKIEKSVASRVRDIKDKLYLDLTFKVVDVEIIRSKPWETMEKYFIQNIRIQSIKMTLRGREETLWQWEKEEQKEAMPVSSELPTEKNFNHEEGFMAYHATSGKTISEKTYENYVKSHYPEIYKNRWDEFAWREGLNKIKGELNERIRRYDISTNYWRWFTTEIGDYDFEAKGFPLDIYDHRMDWLGSGYSWRLLYLKAKNLGRVIVYPENPGDFNFLPYSEDSAKKFLQSRRSESGYVDREVTLVIHFTVLPVKSEESQAVLQRMTRPSGYSLVARINKVEVYEDKDRTKKIGELTKRYEAKRKVEKPEEKSAEGKKKKKSFWREYGPQILPEK